MLYMVLDVESVGLHGEGFAVGAVVIDGRGKEHKAICFACLPDTAQGNLAGRVWVAEHITVPGAFRVTHKHPQAVRAAFWEAWQYWKAKGAVLVADCAWPVEARFLAACVDDAPDTREWQGPYPLHEVATARLLAGFDPLATMDRLPNELPAHNPLADARQSARLWLEALGKLEERFIQQEGRP